MSLPNPAALAVPGLALALVLGSCTPRDDETMAVVTDDDTTPEITPDDDDDSAPAGHSPTISLDVTAGPLPLAVTMTAAGSAAVAGIATFAWDLGDGTVASGEEVTHTYLASGEFTVSMTLTDLDGATSTATAVVTVEAPTCPAMGEPQVTGTVASERLDEVSGVVGSRKNTGVLWVHNDSGDGPHLYALTAEGTHLGVYTLLDVPNGDWEDLAIGLDRGSGDYLLYVGDVGDNGRNRAEVQVHIVSEPDVSAEQEAVEAEVESITIQLVYPDEAAHDSETLLVDPASGDVILVTKEGDSPARAFRKAAPHVDGERVQLELLAELAPGDVLAPGVTTGGDISPLGDRIVVRGYGPTARLWMRDRAVGLAETLLAEPCAIVLPVDGQAESAGFAADGSGLFTIPEGSAATIQFTPF